MSNNQFINTSVRTNQYTLNLTQHLATPEQIEQGVVDLPTNSRKNLIELLTFNEIPSSKEMFDRASKIAMIADLVNYDGSFSQAMIGGAPYFMHALGFALADPVIGLTPVYAFTQRVSVEEVVNGEVIKTSKFMHVGFVQG